MVFTAYEAAMTPEDATALNQNPHGTLDEERDLEAAIGAQVRAQRKKLGMTVGELASLANLSTGMLSKIEKFLSLSPKQRQIS
jgi:DNA-binding transcriptional regulator YiaG